MHSCEHTCTYTHTAETSEAQPGALRPSLIDPTNQQPGLQTCTEMGHLFPCKPETSYCRLRRAAAAFHCHVRGPVPSGGGTSMSYAKRPIAGQPRRPRDERPGARKGGLETPQSRCVRLWSGESSLNPRMCLVTAPTLFPRP